MIEKRSRASETERVIGPRDCRTVASTSSDGMRSGVGRRPTTPQHEAGMRIEKVPAFLGEEWARYVQFVLPVSFARTPAISIPAGLHEGLPVGVQLVGRFAQEYDLLDFAEQLEAMPGFGFQRRPEMDR